MTSTVERGTNRLFIADPNLLSINGHYLTYAGSVANAARSRGVECHILGHASIDAGLAALYGVAPIYRAEIWRNATGGDYFADENQEISNREFFEDTVRALDRFSAGDGDAIFYPTNTAGQIDGIASIVEHFGRRAIRHEILLRYSGNFYRGQVAARGFRRLENLAESKRVRVNSDSHRLAYELGVYTSLPIGVLPIPHTIEVGNDTPALQTNDRPLHLISLGNARGEKGLDEILEAIRLSAYEPWGERLRFTLQVNHPSSDVLSGLNAFRANPDPRVALVTDNLALEAYTDLLRSADGVLVPYHRDIYEARTSGVFLEASAAGKIVVATEDTWMSDLVDVYDNGLLVRDRSAQDLVRALRELVENSASLAKRALSAASRVRAFHNPERMVDCLLGDTPIPYELPRGRRAAIFYPWGDINGRSGAAARTRLLAKYLAEHGRQVRVFCLGNDENMLAPGIAVESYEAGHWHSSALASQIDAFLDEKESANAKIGLHLYYHLWPRIDEDFKRRCLRLVRWADDILVEYTYFAAVVGEMAHREGKSSVVTVHDLVSQIVRHTEPVFSVTRAMELIGFLRSDHIVISNDIEAQIVKNEGFACKTIPTPIDIKAIAALDDEDIEVILEQFLKIRSSRRSLCLFVGGDYAPNQMAAGEIRKMASRAKDDPRLQSVVFVIAGAAHKVEHSENFFALGPVEDLALEALYRAAAIVLIPLEKGTGISVKTVEAFARGCCILSTRIGVRGYPVISGGHCLIEDDFSRYPDLIAGLLAEPSQMAQYQKTARSFGERYDYRKLFVGYGIEAEPEAKRQIEFKPPSFVEFLPRIARGGATPAGLEWLLNRVPLSALSYNELIVLAKACYRMSPDDAMARWIGQRVANFQPETTDEALAKWEFLHDTSGEASISAEAFAAELEPFLRAPGKGGGELRKHIWKLFNAGDDASIMWMCQAIKTRMGGLSDPEVIYVFALVSERFGASRAEIIDLLSLSLKGGFDRGWALYHRGRLRLSSGNHDGREDLTQAIAAGGDAAREAKSMLYKTDMESAWNSFYSGAYSQAAHLTKSLLTQGDNDPSVHYLHGLSLHHSGARLSEALAHYTIALQHGLDPGWVLYHRGRLRLSQGDSGGKDDLQRVLALDKNAVAEARQVLAQHQTGI
jgi:glycosyltransferase involved in cell wall biosynthesis